MLLVVFSSSHPLVLWCLECTHRPGFANSWIGKNRDLLTRAAGAIWVLGPEPALGPFVPPAHPQCHSSAGEQLDNLNFWLWEQELCPRLWLPCHGHGLFTPLSTSSSFQSWKLLFPWLIKPLSPPRCSSETQELSPNVQWHTGLAAGRKRSGKFDFHRFNSPVSQLRLFKGEKSHHKS